VKCREVLQCNDGTSNKVSDIIIRLLDNRKLLLICILLLSHSLVFFRFLFFYKNMVVIYVFLLEEAMYSYFYLCILIVSLCYGCLCVYIFLDAATLTEVFPCFFLSYKAYARVNLAKTGHGPHSPKLLCCSMYCLFCVLCIVCV